MAKFKITNKIFLRYIKRYEEAKSIGNFEKNCNEFIEFLDNLPSKFESKGMSLEKWTELLIKNPHQAEFQKNFEYNEIIKFNWVISSFKVNRLFKTILELLNKDEIYCAIPLIRVYLEVICFSNFYMEKIKELIDRMNSNLDDYLQYCQIGQEFDNLSKKIKKGSRMKLLQNEIADASNIDSIGQVIKEVSRSEDYKFLWKHYRILCEITHPNMLSSDIFSRITELQKDSFKFHSEDRMGFLKGENDLYVRDIPFPIEGFFLHFGSPLYVLDKGMKLFKETVEKNKKIILFQSTDKKILNLFKIFKNPKLEKIIKDSNQDKN